MAMRAAEKEKESLSTENESICRECSGGLISDESGELVCEECGLVYDETVIDRGAEWRSFDDGLTRRNPKRVGAPITKLRHDDGLSSKMGNIDRDGNGNLISGSKKRNLRRMQKWNKRYQVDKHERGIRYALSEIKRMGSALGISRDIQETAAVIYRRCADEDLLVGYSFEGVATASLYIAARQAGTPRSLKEFFTVCRLSGTNDQYNNSYITSIGRVYRHIQSELDITLEPVDPAKYLDRYITELDFEDDMVIRKDAEKFIEAVTAANVHSGVSPGILAATAVYCSAGVNGQYRTQRRVCEVADIVVETLRRRYKDFCDVVGVETSALKYSGCVDAVFE